MTKSDFDCKNDCRTCDENDWCKFSDKSGVKMKLVSLFSGIGAFEKALTNLKIDFELINFCEIDKYAEKSYCAIHNVDPKKNLGDIKKVKAENIPDFDMLTWGFPCTDLSVAGNQKGFYDENGNITRSGLYFEGLRILKAKKPKYSIIENVKALTSKKFKTEFDMILSDLKELGYNSYWQILNSKDYEIPQSRERIFIVSIRNDIDKKYIFPEKKELKLRLKDLLEEQVDSKYYLKQEIVDRFKKLEKANVVGTTKPDCRTIGQRDLVYNPEGVIGTLCSTDYKQPKQVINYWNDRKIEDIAPSLLTTCGNWYGKSSIVIAGELDCPGWHRTIKAVYDKDGISPTLTTMQGGNTQPKIVVEGNIEGINVVQAKQVYSTEGISPTVTTMGGSGQHIKIKQELSIRRVTPKECFRLMGFSDSDYEKVKAIGISDTQMYKQCGNSIVVNVLEHILKNLLL